VNNNNKLIQSFLDDLMERINGVRQYGNKLTMKNLNSTWQPEWFPLGTWETEEGVVLKGTSKFSIEKLKTLFDESITVKRRRHFQRQNQVSNLY
jgi:hypothetical protein